MKMIIGGAYQGKRAYAEKAYQISIWAEGEDCGQEELFSCRGIADFHLYLHRLLQEGKEQYVREQLVKELSKKNPELVIVTNELGYGIVPVDPFDRNWREVTGRVCTELAFCAEEVIRVVCGIPVILKQNGAERKGEKKDNWLRIDLIRHGMTEGNRRRCYIGITDEPLCDSGRTLALGCQYPQTELVFVSPMKRCIETAKILYPGQKLYSIEELRECDFGMFEGKNAEELSGNEAYQRWIDSNATLPFPGGESRETFRDRSLNGWRKVLAVCEKRQASSAAVVTHGGVIMNLMETVTAAEKTFYEWHVKNLCGYSVYIEKELEKDEKLDTACGAGRLFYRSLGW